MSFFWQLVNADWAGMLTGQCCGIVYQSKGTKLVSIHSVAPHMCICVAVPVAYFEAGLLQSAEGSKYFFGLDLVIRLDFARCLLQRFDSGVTRYWCNSLCIARYGSGNVKGGGSHGMCWINIVDSHVAGPAPYQTLNKQKNNMYANFMAMYRCLQTLSPSATCGTSGLHTSSSAAWPQTGPVDRASALHNTRHSSAARSWAAEHDCALMATERSTASVDAGRNNGKQELCLTKQYQVSF